MMTMIVVMMLMFAKIRASLPLLPQYWFCSCNLRCWQFRCRSDCISKVIFYMIVQLYMFDILKVVYITTMSALQSFISSSSWYSWHIQYLYLYFVSANVNRVDIYHASCIVGNNGLQGHLEISLALQVCSVQKSCKIVIKFRNAQHILYISLLNNNLM